MGLTEDKKQQLREAGKSDAMHRMMTVMQKHDIGIIGKDDLHYPQLLLNISDPPHFLFYRGNIDCLNERCITIVGSRSASDSALLATEDISR